MDLHFRGNSFLRQINAGSKRLKRCCSGPVKSQRRQRRELPWGISCSPLSLVEISVGFFQPNVHVVIIRHLINNSKVTGVFLKISQQLNNGFCWPLSTLSLSQNVCVCLLQRFRRTFFQFTRHANGKFYLIRTQHVCVCVCTEVRSMSLFVKFISICVQSSVNLIYRKLLYIKYRNITKYFQCM